MLSSGHTSLKTDKNSSKWSALLHVVIPNTDGNDCIAILLHKDTRFHYPLALSIFIPMHLHRCFAGQHSPCNQQSLNAGKSSISYSLAIKNRMEKGNVFFLLTLARIGCFLNSTFMTGEHVWMTNVPRIWHPTGRTVFCVPCSTPAETPTSLCWPLCYVALIFLNCSESIC